MIHPQPDGFLAAPPSGAGPGVLVLHAWWGLNDTLKAFCTRLGDSGFVAFAPDLYHGKVADNRADAGALGNALEANHLQAKAEIADAAKFLNERVGLVAIMATTYVSSGIIIRIGGIIRRHFRQTPKPQPETQVG